LLENSFQFLIPFDEVSFILHHPVFEFNFIFRSIPYTNMARLLKKSEHKKQAEA